MLRGTHNCLEEVTQHTRLLLDELHTPEAVQDKAPLYAWITPEEHAQAWSTRQKKKERTSAKSSGL
jgi:hypothetical protein